MAGRISALTVLHFLAAIAVDLFALTLWNLGARAPSNLVRDGVAVLRSPRRLMRAASVTLVGLLLLIGGAGLVVPLAATWQTRSVIVIWTFVTALVVEALIGADLRRERS